MSLLKARPTYKPFLYPEYYEMWKQAHQTHWIADEVSMAGDISDWKTKLTEAEKNLVGHILKGFTTSEIHIEDYWASKVARWFKHPEIQMLAHTFASFESIHADGYDKLNSSLGLEDYEAFLHDETTKAKIDRLMSTKGKDIRSIAKSLAIFSAFNEGVNLFSAFAILLNFSRFNKMKGMSQIISWSINDECLTDGHEVLTPKGWVDLKDFDCETMEVAQFNNQTREISFVKALRKIEKEIDEEVICFDGESGHFLQTVTKNHRLPYAYRPNGIYKGNKEATADNLSLNSYNYLLLSGNKTGTKKKLTNFERFLIATQADGYVSPGYNGKICGTVSFRFVFSKERKINRFLDLVKNLGFNITNEKEIKKGGNVKDQISYTIAVPIDILNQYGDPKSLSWVNLSEVDSSWCKEFLEELVEWDEYKAPEGGFYYSSVVKENAEIVNTIAHLCGMSAFLSVQKDERSDNFNDVYLVFYSNQNEKQGKSVEKRIEHYKGTVRCITVPTGFFLVRYKGHISVTGNCQHSAAGCKLFNQLIKEHPEVWDDELKKEIYDAARLTIELEDRYIDKAFEMGPVEGLTKEHIKNFIRHRANQKLQEIGLKSNWKNINKELLDEMQWFDVLSSGVSHFDFFAGKDGSYSKASSMDWESIWTEEKK